MSATKSGASKRKRGGQPGNSNAVKRGRHTADKRRARRDALVQLLVLRLALTHARRALAARKKEEDENKLCHPRRASLQSSDEREGDPGGEIESGLTAWVSFPRSALAHRPRRE
jgi:hypothetical protein